MENIAIAVLLFALCSTSGQNVGTNNQRFEADKFLDMLSRSFDPQVAYLDLMAALTKRLNSDPAINGSSGAPALGSPLDSEPSLRVDSGLHCPLAPEKTGATVTYTTDNRVVGSRALYQCDTGYEGRSLFIQCTNDGTWSTPTGWDGCKAVDCGAPPPSVLNADSSYTTTTFGSMVIYTCQNGFKLDRPAANVTCLDTGYWDTPSFSCQKSNNPTGMDMTNLAALGALLGGGGNQQAGPSKNPMIEMLLKGLPGFPGSLPAPPTPPPTTTTEKPANVPSQLPMGFQLPSHLQSLLPNGISSAQGFKPQDLLALASVGLGSSSPAAAPRDLNQLLGSMNPMSLLGSAMGIGMPGASPTAPRDPTGAAAPPMEPEKVAEQREEMMMRAMMSMMMKSMMQPSAPASGNTTAPARPTTNPAMEMMTLMALQNGLAGGGAGSGSGGSNAGMDPMALMFGGMSPSIFGLGGSGGGNPFASLFGGA